jgi:hypothetical protein
MESTMATAFMQSFKAFQLTRSVRDSAVRFVCPSARRMRMVSTGSVDGAAKLPTREELLAASFMDSVQYAGKLMLIVGEDLEPSTVPLLEAMLSSSNGARGFFVTLLSQPDVVLADQRPLPAELKRIPRDNSTDSVFAELLVKNVVMSSAMVSSFAQCSAERSQCSSLEKQV